MSIFAINSYVKKDAHVEINETCLELDLLSVIFG